MDAGLASRLNGIADRAARAARLAEGDYINPPSLFDLQRAHKDAGRAIMGLRDVMPQLAAAGDDGARLAKDAVDYLEAGQDVLRNGVSVQDDILRGGTAVIDDVATGGAHAFFDRAAFTVRGLADGATLGATPLDDLFRAITQIR